MFLPELALEVLLDDKTARYDAVVVDEGQDLLSPMVLDVLDVLLDGGLAHGTWRVFYDGNQNVLGGTAPAALKQLRGLPTTLFHQHKLSRHPSDRHQHGDACVRRA